MASTPVVSDDTGSLDKKKKKRDERNLQRLMHSVEHLTTVDEKFQLVCKKYLELCEESRTPKEQAADAQKKLAQVVKERDHLQGEYNKLVLAKDRLESLCRELQKVNRVIKEDSANIARTTEEKRQEVSATFETKIREIQTQIGEYHEQNLRLRAENDNLAGKLKEFVEQFEQRTQQMDRVIKTKDLEAQLAEAKLKQAKIQMEDLTTRHTQEVAKFMGEVEHYQKRFEAMEQIETKLREQNDFYRTKYDEFSATLAQSTQVYATYKTELEKMAKRVEQLSKEAINWKKKFENSNMSALTLAKEKLENEKTIGTLTNKVTALEKLCRALRSQSSASATPEREIGPTVPANLPSTSTSDPPPAYEEAPVSSTSEVSASVSTVSPVQTENVQVPSTQGETKSEDSSASQENSQPLTQESGDTKECCDENSKQGDQ